jgi:hypothetical protein
MRSRVAGVPYGGFGECQKDRADPAAGARRRDIQCRDAISVYFYPADRGPFHGYPHVMFSHRPRHAICCPSRGPSFGLFPRHRWYSQRENGTTSYTCERFLVSGLGTPNLHQAATTWPDSICLELRYPIASFCVSSPPDSAIPDRRFSAPCGPSTSRATGMYREAPQDITRPSAVRRFPSAAHGARIALGNRTRVSVTTTFSPYLSAASDLPFPATCDATRTCGLHDPLGPCRSLRK